jgi:hypothetical protein
VGMQSRSFRVLVYEASKGAMPVGTRSTSYDQTDFLESPRKEPVAVRVDTLSGFAMACRKNVRLCDKSIIAARWPTSVAKAYHTADSAVQHAILETVHVK